MSTIASTAGLLQQLSQHPTLPMLVTSSHAPMQPPSGVALGAPRRLSAYMLFVMIEGNTTHQVDLRPVSLSTGHAMFIQPHAARKVLRSWPAPAASGR
ncbi:hypothetical protein [Dinghuibacter silviterrae]|uniref:hypothetical protein n=1 Tax=Dinghuibacter silviterrae TaxID=1539049 RepID=UPI001062902E|nr:hypothetical protein [Dinghuibacter silviterrae]